jgi:hypothetical protein
MAKLAIFVSLLLAHVAACYFYYLWSAIAPADASIYYYDVFNLSSEPGFFRGQLVAKICKALKHLFNASYLDCFLLFQSFSFVGLMLLARTSKEIQLKIQVPEHRGPLILLFLPSVNFWPSAIGKDAPIFFAISLSVWAMLSLRRRIIPFLVAVGVMILFRAHIAFMAATALGIAALFGSSRSFGEKVGLLGLSAVGLWITSSAVQSTLGVDTMSISSVSGFINQKNDIFATVGGTTAVSGASFPVKLLSLLFRPLFFDGGGTLGMVASFENIAVIILTAYFAINAREIVFLAHRVAFVRFAAAFALVILFTLTLIYYNVGLGIRERVMAFPMVYSILVALWAWKRKRRAATPIAAELMAQAHRNNVPAQL